MCAERGLFVPVMSFLHATAHMTGSTPSVDTLTSNTNIGGTMNHRIDRKRVAGVVGLVAALSITASGCSLIPGMGNSTEPAQGQIASYDPSKVVGDAEFQAAHGVNPAWTTDIAKSGLSLVSTMFEKHPEYTVEGFVPTQDNWNDVLNQLAPFLSESATETLNASWYDNKSLPVLTSGTFAREGCTEGDQPYDVSLDGASVTSTHDDMSGANNPTFVANVTVTIRCKEGGTLKGQMHTSIPMTQEKGWRMHKGATSEAVGEFAMVK